MPRYFFHLHHRGAQRDEVGTVLASDKEAWSQGVAACSEFMHDLDGQMDDRSEYRMECQDEAGQQVFVLHLRAEKFFADER